MPQDAEQFSGIFINYRRDDSAGHSGRLFDRLSRHFGDNQVFIDIDHIEPGVDFVEALEDSLSSCEILITVIGKRWLLSSSGDSRRLDDSNDFVRVEINAALNRNIRVIPVLVDGATMPKQRDLPDDLSRLARRQAVELSDQRWNHDIERLITALEKALTERKEARLKAAREEEERQQQQAAEELRRREEERSKREEEERIRREEEERNKREEETRLKLEEQEERNREEAAALAVRERQEREEEKERQRKDEEQQQREAEEERQRVAEAQRAQELERKRRQSSEAEHQRRKAEESARLIREESAAVKERQRLEEEEKGKREAAATQAAEEQKQREAEEEKQREVKALRRAEELEREKREAEESERKRREAEESERKRREAEEQSPARAVEVEPEVTRPVREHVRQPFLEDFKSARPSAIDRRVLLAVAGSALVVAVVAVWWLSAGGGRTSNAGRQQAAATPGASQPGDAVAAGPVAPVGMVYVPGGEFKMGRDDGDESERPAHVETVKAFFIDAYEVTCGDYEKFVKEDRHPPPPGWKGVACPAGAARKPVTGVIWGDAGAFCYARSKRLPTEQEWEFAARGKDGRRYPWGNDWRAGLANADGASSGMVDVGSYQAGNSPFGAFDMVGNAWEWTAADMTAYPGGKLPANVPDGLKVIRGCFYQCNKEGATATFRRGWPPSGHYDYGNTGFRCAKDAVK